MDKTKLELVMFLEKCSLNMDSLIHTIRKNHYLNVSQTQNFSSSFYLACHLF